jgi:hypothetical protein
MGVPQFMLFAEPSCSPGSVLPPNQMNWMGSLPYSGYCLHTEPVTLRVTCAGGVAYTQLFDNAECEGQAARNITFCSDYCSDSDASDSEGSDGPPECLLQSCGAEAIAVVEATMQTDDILQICNAVEPLHTSGCMHACTGTEDVADINQVLRFCGMDELVASDDGADTGGEQTPSVPARINTAAPTKEPTTSPTLHPTTRSPTTSPTAAPTSSPTGTPFTEVLFNQTFTELDINQFDDTAFEVKFRSDYVNKYAAAFDVSPEHVEIVDIYVGSVVVRTLEPLPRV